MANNSDSLDEWTDSIKKRILEVVGSTIDKVPLDANPFDYSLKVYHWVTVTLLSDLSSAPFLNSGSLQKHVHVMQHYLDNGFSKLSDDFYF